MTCINRNYKDNQRLINDFSEVKVSQMFDKYYKDVDNPSYEEFISNPNVKKDLGIVPISKVKDELGQTFPKQISQSQLIKLKSLVLKINNKLTNELLLLFNLTQVGQSDLYNWGLRKVKGNLDIQAKLDRAIANAKNTIASNNKIKELKDKLPEWQENLFGEKYQADGNESQKDLEQGLKWLKTILPEANYEIINGLIDGIGRGSYSSMEDLMKFSKEYADKGTVKNETFHKFFNSLPKEKQEELLDEGSKLFNIPRGKSEVITKYSQSQQNEINITPQMASEAIKFQSPKLEYQGDLAIEEKMAEMMETTPDEKLPKTKLGKWIQSIRNFFRNLFKEKTKIERFLRDINQGRVGSNFSNPNESIKYSLNNQQNNSFQQFQQSLNKPNINPILKGNQTNIEEIITQLEKEGLLEIDCKGKLKAEKGLATSFTKGGKWEIYEIFEGKSHKQGGIDINIKNNQISFTNKNGSIKAKYGLVVPKDN